MTYMESDYSDKKSIVSVNSGSNLAKIIGDICYKTSKQYNYCPDANEAVVNCEKMMAVNEIIWGDTYDDIKVPDKSFFEKMLKVFQKETNLKEKVNAMVKLLQEITDEQKCEFLYNYLMAISSQWDFEPHLDFFATVK